MVDKSLKEYRFTINTFFATVDVLKYSVIRADREVANCDETNYFYGQVIVVGFGEAHEQREHGEWGVNAEEGDLEIYTYDI